MARSVSAIGGLGARGGEMAAGVRQGWGGTGVGEKIEVERLNWVRE